MTWLTRLRGWAKPSQAPSLPTAANTVSYPWFAIAEGDDLEQGDILESCPVFFPPEDLALTAERPSNATFNWKDQDLIVLSQSCDLSKGREKIDEILLCAIWKRSEVPEFAKDNHMETLRKGREPAFHVIATSALPGFEREVRVVDFRRVYSLPVPFVRKRAVMGKRLRLLPPYREHLSQSFARFFMRVGLPIDIPPFK